MQQLGIGILKSNEGIRRGQGIELVFKYFCKYQQKMIFWHIFMVVS